MADQGPLDRIDLSEWIAKELAHPRLSPTGNGGYRGVAHPGGPDGAGSANPLRRVMRTAAVDRGPTRILYRNCAPLGEGIRS